MVIRGYSRRGSPEDNPNDDVITGNNGFDKPDESDARKVFSFTLTYNDSLCPRSVQTLYGATDYVKLKSNTNSEATEVEDKPV